MALSKPGHIMLNLVGNYLEKLYTRPIKTKVMTSLVTALAGSALCYTMFDTSSINNNTLACSIFGLLLNTPLQHYFYTYSDLYVNNIWALFLIERLIYTPLYRALVMYSISVLQRKPPKYDEMKRLLPIIIIKNLKYMSLLHYLNIKYVPPMFRDMVVNFCNIILLLYFAIKNNRRSKKEKKEISEKTKTEKLIL